MVFSADVLRHLRSAPASTVFRCLCSWVGVKSPRSDGLRCQRRRPRVPLPPWRRWHDPAQTSSSSTGGNPRSGLPDRAATASPRRCPLEGAALAASGVPDAAAEGWRVTLTQIATLGADLRGATFANVGPSPMITTPVPAGPCLSPADSLESRHMGARCVGLGSLGDVIVLGGA